MVILQDQNSEPRPGNGNYEFALEYGKLLKHLDLHSDIVGDGMKPTMEKECLQMIIGLI